MCLRESYIMGYDIMSMNDSLLNFIRELLDPEDILGIFMPGFIAASIFILFPHNIYEFLFISFIGIFFGVILYFINDAIFRALEKIGLSKVIGRDENTILWGSYYESLDACGNNYLRNHIIHNTMWSLLLSNMSLLFILIDLFKPDIIQNFINNTNLSHIDIQIWHFQYIILPFFILIMYYWAVLCRNAVALGINKINNNIN